MITASSVGHPANAVTALYSLYCGQFYAWLYLMSLFFLEGINEIFRVASHPKQTPANSEARTMMSQIQNFSYKPQLFHFTKVPLIRLNPVPVATAHPSPKGPHVNHLFPKDWYEKRVGG